METMDHLELATSLAGTGKTDPIDFRAGRAQTWPGRRPSWPALGVCLGLLAGAWPAPAQPFRLPTANRALFEKGGEERFYAPTVGKPWTSGLFGCVRSDGWQMHEGVDIRSIQRDKRGEPTDPVLATADGVVAYVNHKSGLSNYGKYIILRHAIEGVEVYSLYAHLGEIAAGFKPGSPVRSGQTIGVLGRTTNTRSAIGKDRAHVHFELNLLINDRFAEWFKKTHPGERNDHGLWNGRNMLGLDPSRIFLEQQAMGAQFSLRGFLRSHTELCRVLVRAPRFPWLQRYAALIEASPDLAGQPPAGYELVLDYNGLPFRLIPRPASAFQGAAKYTAKYKLLSVNAAEYAKNHCRKLVSQQGRGWQLTSLGQKLLDQLTY
jgi:peptidoglycan LD-endopeptidase LytH